MDLDWSALVWAGFVATTLSASLFWICRMLDLTTFSPTAQLGCLFFDDPRTPLSDSLGFVLLYLVGSLLLPRIYLEILPGFGKAGWETGALLGGVQGALMVAFLPLLGTISACVRRGKMPPPGRFGLEWGRATPLVILTGHVLYGGLLAALLRAFRAAVG